MDIERYVDYNIASGIIASGISTRLVGRFGKFHSQMVTIPLISENKLTDMKFNYNFEKWLSCKF